MTGYLGAFGILAVLALVIYGVARIAAHHMDRRTLQDTARARLRIVPATTSMLDDEEEGYDALAAVRNDDATASQMWKSDR